MILRDKRMVWQRRTILTGFCGLLAFRGTPLQADTSAQTLLHVVPLDGPGLALDRAALEALPQVSFDTTTIWTEGRIAFRGPRLHDVLAAAGITKGRILLKALNDYEVEMGLEELGEDWPIIATRQNGQPFDVRDQGPLWLVFPYDEKIAISPERMHTLSVWQLVQVQELAP